MPWSHARALRLTIAMNRSDRVYIAGHRGLVGSAVLRRLVAAGYSNILVRERAQLDLTDQTDVERYFAENKPQVVILAAAKVGGIRANSEAPAEFIQQNVLIQANVIESAYMHGAEKLLFLGSSCIYPKHAPQPMPEDCLLTGPLEPTNEWYAIAKIAGLKTCQAYRRQYGFNAIAAMPTNLYGPEDNFNLETSHVLPALIRKFHEAKQRRDQRVVIWGTGAPRREFLFVEDCADALVFLIENYNDEAIINVGVGADVSIRQLAEIVRSVVGFDGTLEFDTSKPDGAPRKLLDVSRLSALGWKASTPLADGVHATYRWFKANESSFRR
jgi:GDP-L-fucose synthase